MSKILIAIKCCHARQDFAEASRQTWIKNIPNGIDYRIFYGHGESASRNSKGRQDSTTVTNRCLRPDEVQIDSPDGYEHLATKIYEIIKWAYEQGYDYLLQLDDDSYARPEALVKSNLFNIDFAAGVSVGLDEHQRIFQYINGQSATGPGFWLSRKAMGVIVDSPRPANNWADEPWVGQVLNSEGIFVSRTGEMGCYGALPMDGSSHEFVACSFPPEEKIIAEWEYNPDQMRAIHEQWTNGTRKLPRVSFWNVGGVKIYP